jgi:hypothetical protein
MKEFFLQLDACIGLIKRSNWALTPRHGGVSERRGKAFLTSALDGKRSASRLGRFTTWGNSSIHARQSRSGFVDEEKNLWPALL